MLKVKDTLVEFSNNISPHMIGMSKNKHILLLFGTSVQVTVVMFVVAGQLPQFDVIMLNLVSGQSQLKVCTHGTEYQLKKSFKFTMFHLILSTTLGAITIIITLLI